MLQRVRIWFAAQLLRGTDRRVARTAQLAATHDAIAKAFGLVQKSGHLSRAYHVGKKLNVVLGKALMESETT